MLTVITSFFDRKLSLPQALRGNAQQRLTLLCTIAVLAGLFTSTPLFAESSWPALPEAVSNNAVALVTTEKNRFLISFNGIGKNKGYRAVHNKVWALKIGDRQWQARSPVPSSLPLAGRLASVAVGVGKYAYVFGGYTVDKDHHEISAPDMQRYDVLNDTYQLLEPMPVAVDDSVALVYRDRFIYLVSGWHNDGNVNLVQVYDIKKNTWQQASPFPGRAVFGHAAGIVDNAMVVCDGVGVHVKEKQKREFKIENRCFLGGTSNAYNYNGIGYNGQASAAENSAFILSLKSRAWRKQLLGRASMDHRALLEVGEDMITVGGMGDGQQVLNSVLAHTLDTEPGK